MFFKFRGMPLAKLIIMNNTNVKERFLLATRVTSETDALRNCVLASFRRNNIYSTGAVSQRRSRLREDLKARLTALGNSYVQGSLSEAEHEANIVNLANALSDEHSDILVNGRFKIGTSQKALNLYLKFLWCLGRLPEDPHHCPVDRIVLSSISLNGTWTRLDDIATYRAWIVRIREAAGARSLSDWELDLWNGIL